MKRETVKATTKFRSMPTLPMPSGEIPNHQCSAVLAVGFTNLK